MDGLVAMVQKVADIAIAVLVTIPAIAAPCVAQDPTVPGYILGNRLLESCTSAVERDNALCFGYVIGVSDAMQVAQTTGGGLFGWQACLPPSTIAEQVTEVAVRFLIAHPEALQSSASGLIAKALSDAFPCPPK
jgi:Rap1a immunity proteins